MAFFFFDAITVARPVISWRRGHTLKHRRNVISAQIRLPSAGLSVSASRVLMNIITTDSVPEVHCVDSGLLLIRILISPDS